MFGSPIRNDERDLCSSKATSRRRQQGSRTQLLAATLARCCCSVRGCRSVLRLSYIQFSWKGLPAPWRSSGGFSAAQTSSSSEVRAAEPSSGCTSNCRQPDRCCYCRPCRAASAQLGACRHYLLQCDGAPLVRAPDCSSSSRPPRIWRSGALSPMPSWAASRQQSWRRQRSRRQAQH